jgi:hypothetical protein
MLPVSSTSSAGGPPVPEEFVDDGPVTHGEPQRDLSLTRHRSSRILRNLIPWLVAAGSFGYLYVRLSWAADSQGFALSTYVARILGAVDWGRWLALMIPYTVLYFLVDTAVVWRAVTWFNTPLTYREVIPIRGSAYVLSIVNEQVGKGAMALYLNRRYGIPGGEAASTMLFIMVCEYCHLLVWATVGVVMHGDRMPGVFRLIPWIGAASAVLLVFLHLFFTGRLGSGAALRRRSLVRTFATAKLWQYGAIIVLRSPLMLAAVGVYTLAMPLFGVPVTFGQMVGYLPVVLVGASTPGPMRSVAVVLWVTLFPDHAGEIAAFGIFQHNGFLLLNAVIGLLFIRRATRSLFAAPSSG